jgi:uncharacterized coiled-coil DUF342 family protein
MTYLTRYRSRQGEILQLQNDIAKLIMEEDQLTAAVAGLRDQIAALDATRQRQEEEIRQLKPELLIYLAEGQLILKRRDSLQARRDELRRLPPLDLD